MSTICDVTCWIPTFSLSLSVTLSGQVFATCFDCYHAAACPFRTRDVLEALALVASSSSSSVARADFDSLMMLLIFVRRLLSWRSQFTSLRRCDV